MHEQKFKDPLSSTCPLSSERIVLDLKSEVHERPGFYHDWGSITTGGNILPMDFFCFHVVKPLMPILALLPISSSL